MKAKRKRDIKKEKKTKITKRYQKLITQRFSDGCTAEEETRE